jgi:hypothetical protein
MARIRTKHFQDMTVEWYCHTDLFSLWTTARDMYEFKMSCYTSKKTPIYVTDPFANMLVNITQNKLAFKIFWV